MSDAAEKRRLQMNRTCAPDVMMYSYTRITRLPVKSMRLSTVSLTVPAYRSSAEAFENTTASTVRTRATRVGEHVLRFVGSNDLLLIVAV